MKHIELIVEIGINWGGDLLLAKRLIETVKTVGANTAKFQLYDPRKLFPNGEVIARGRNWYEDILWMKDFGEKEVKELKNYCSELDLDFLCSSFDLEGLAILERIGVKRHKIATRMNQNFNYIQAVIDTGKEILLSCELDWSVPTPPFYLPLYRTKFLYCVPEYPTPLNHLSIPLFKRLEGNIEGWNGFSDHTIGPEASMIAMARGATIVEKHFSLDPSSKAGPDHICSASPEEMRRLVEFARKVEQIL